MVEEKRALVILDMDGVLVDVRPSYHRAILETVRHFTGCRVAEEEIGRFKVRSGFNDDWKLTHAWIHELGGKAGVREVVTHFQQLYRGRNFRGYIRLERLLADRRALGRLGRAADLAIFTGRPREEALYTLRRFRIRNRFARIVALEDGRPKPHPDGLRRLANGRRRSRVLYAGDTADDALAAGRAGVPFLAVVDPQAPRRALRVRELRRLGARAILESVNEVGRWLP